MGEGYMLEQVECDDLVSLFTVLPSVLVYFYIHN